MSVKLMFPLCKGGREGKIGMYVASLFEVFTSHIFFWLSKKHLWSIYCVPAAATDDGCCMMYQ